MSAKQKHQKNKNLSFVRSSNQSKQSSKRLLENSEYENGVIAQTSDFSDILRKKWKIFRVSPIFNFHSSKLNVYGKKFTEEMNAKKAFGSDVTYHCAFTLNKKIRLGDKDREVLQVEVITDKSKNVYLAYFISWSCVNDYLQQQNFVSLPILLVESNDRIAQKIHTTFCKMFDCDIQPVAFSLHALIAFLVKFLESPNPTDSQECLTLEFKIPGCQPKDSIKLTLVLEDTVIVLAVIIDSLHEKVPGISNMEVILEFYNRLLNHIYHVYKMDLMMAELNKISLPYAFISADGQMKITSDVVAESALIVLQHYTPLDAVLSN